jgi:IS1 family transposase
VAEVSILPFEKQVIVIAALCEGMSIRSVERLTGIHRDTIMRLGVRVGAGCERLHDYYMQQLTSSVIELDELWAFIGKKRRKVKPGAAPELGDCYTFIALDAVNKAIIAYRSGKRDGETTEHFLADLRSRVIGTPFVSSDAFNQYERSVQRTFGKRIEYGQLVKKYHGEPAIDAARRYSPGVVVAVERRPLIGNPPPEALCTSHVERLNLSMRMSQRRFTRLTNAFSKKIENHAAAVALFVAHYNLCRVHEALRITPAMALGVTGKIWSIADLIEGAIQGNVEPKGKRRMGFRVIEGGL